MASKLPKKPKSPKQSASYDTWKRYEERVKEWKKKCAKIESDKKAKKALIGRLSKA